MRINFSKLFHVDEGVEFKFIIDYYRCSKYFNNPEDSKKIDKKYKDILNKKYIIRNNYLYEVYEGKEYFTVFDLNDLNELTTQYLEYKDKGLTVCRYALCSNGSLLRFRHLENGTFDTCEIYIKGKWIDKAMSFDELSKYNIIFETDLDDDIYKFDNIDIYKLIKMMSLVKHQIDF